MSPYFRAEDVPEPFCKGSYSDEWEWEGRIEDCPDIVVCPICGVKLVPDKEQYETEEKKGLWYAYIPSHYAGESNL